MTEESPRDGFGRALVNVAASNPRVTVLGADLTESIRLQKFAETYPDRFFEMGVAEQNMMGVAAGMAMAGAIPFACSFAAFNPGRNWDQLRVSVCYQQANVKVIGAHAGLSVGPDGATHQALEDLAITRVLPNLCVIAPTDALETEKAVAFAVAHEGPVYIRFGRDKVPTVTTPETPFVYGKANLLQSGKDVAILACGPLVAMALQAAQELLTQNIQVAVVAVPFIKPLDHQMMSDLALATGAFVVAEDAQIVGGLGGAVAEYITATHPIPIEFVGVKDSFGQSGTAAELYQAHGITVAGLVDAAKMVISRKASYTK